MTAQAIIPPPYFDETIEEWVGFDLRGIARFGQTEDGVLAKISEANRIAADHDRHCPEDQELVDNGYHDWVDDPVNFKCNGIF